MNSNLCGLCQSAYHDYSDFKVLSLNGPVLLRLCPRCDKFVQKVSRFSTYREKQYIRER